jgi:hypothetical protein
VSVVFFSWGGRAQKKELKFMCRTMRKGDRAYCCNLHLETSLTYILHAACMHLNLSQAAINELTNIH